MSATKTSAKRGKKPSAKAYEKASTPEVAAPLPVRSAPDPQRDARIEALMNEILTAPGDLDLRRVLADLLIEAGDPRGEYIQLACQLAELSEDDERRADLKRAVTSLEARNNLAWSSPLRRVGGFNGGHPEWGSLQFAFSRGFIETLDGPPKETAARLDDAARAAPIRTLRLNEVMAADLQELANRKALRQVRDLQLHVHHSQEAASDSALATLFASPNIERLEALRFNGEISAATIETLGNAPALDGLSELEVSTPIGPEGLARLDALGKLSKVSRLKLTNAKIGLEGLSIIARLGSLRHLHLENEPIGPKGAAQLAASKALGELRSLTLINCDLGDKGTLALVSSSNLGKLTSLDVSSNGFNGKKIGSILDGFSLPSVVRLGLGNSNLKVDGAKALAACDRLGNVRHLDIAGNMLKADGAAALAKAQGYSKLETLVLARNGLDALGLRAIVDGPFMQNVKHLNLAGNKCGTEGGKELATWKALPRLRSLRLFYNWMGVLGLRNILERAEDLEVLDAGENNYNSEPLKSVAARANSVVRDLTSYTGDSKATIAFARSKAGRNVERLSVGSLDLTEECATALAEMPALGRLQLGFPKPVGQAAHILRKRFGPFVEVWGMHRDWVNLPGPE